jgi:hypothetical protein
VGVAFGEAGELGRVKSGVHAGEDGEVPRRRHGEIALFAETGCVLLVSGEDFLEDFAAQGKRLLCCEE